MIALVEKCLENGVIITVVGENSFVMTKGDCTFNSSDFKKDYLMKAAMSWIEETTRKFKIGDTVYSFDYGEGVVDHFSKTPNEAIKVIYAHGAGRSSYRIDGRFTEEDYKPTLFTKREWDAMQAALNKL